ncbi:MAG: hypothetical protein WA949_05465 [Phormidesmis sp.]
MSISSIKPDRKSRQKPVKNNKPNDQPLTLSQALTITAGMAGLVGLVSGVVIRFSLAHSSDARFFSPLQTFPALSNRTSDSVESGSDSLTPQADTNDPAPVQRSADSPSSFDDFADRSQRSPQSFQDPLEKLRSGPLLRGAGGFNLGGADTTIPELEDPAFEPYFDTDDESRRFAQ